MQGSRCDTSRNKVAVGEPVAGSDRSKMDVWEVIPCARDLLARMAMKGAAAGDMYRSSSDDGTCLK